MLRKLSFYLLLLLFALFTLYDVVNITRTFLFDNTDSDMFVVFNETMTMPNITFCMFKEHAWSHFNRTGLTAADIDATAEVNDGKGKRGLKELSSREDFLNKPWPERMVLDAYMIVQTVNSMELETSSLGFLHTANKMALDPNMGDVRKAMKKWLTAIADRGVSFDELQQKVGNETLQKSLRRFQRLRNSEDGSQVRNGVRITWISTRQLCFQPLYDANNFFGIEEPDQFFTLSIVHNKKTMKELSCMTIDFHGRPSEEARYLGRKGETNDGFYDQLCLALEHEMEVEVREMFTSLPDDEKPPEQRCRRYGDGTEEGEWDKSELRCRSRCKLELIRKACKCTAHSLGHLVDPAELERFPLCDYSTCKIKPEHANLSSWDDKCGAGCLPDCTQIRYRVKNIPKRAAEDDVTQVTLFWNAFDYHRWVQKPKLSVSKFMSTLGGSMGVWLGLSALSIVQFIFFLMDQAHKKVNQRRGSTAAEGRGTQQAERERERGGAKQRKLSNNPFGGGDIAMNPLKSGFNSGGRDKRPS